MSNQLKKDIATNFRTVEACESLVLVALKLRLKLKNLVSEENWILLLIYLMTE